MIIRRDFHLDVDEYLSYFFSCVRAYSYECEYYVFNPNLKFDGNIHFLERTEEYVKLSETTDDVIMNYVNIFMDMNMNQSAILFTGIQNIHFYVNPLVEACLRGLINPSEGAEIIKTFIGEWADI